MRPSAKKNAKDVPFQTVTRLQARALEAKVAPVVASTVKVVLEKLKLNELKISKGKSPSPRRNSKSPSPKRNNSISPVRNAQPGTFRSEIEVIDLSGTTTSLASNKRKRKQTTITKTTSGNNGKKCKMTTRVIKGKSQMAKTVATSGDGNKRKRAKTVHSKVSCSSSGKTCKGRNCCCNRSKRDDCINDLQNKIKELQENEESMQRKILIYENLGLAHLAKEAENKALLKEKQELQVKLLQTENDFLHSFEEEEKEIEALEKRKKKLEITLIWRKTQRNDRGEADEEDLRVYRLRVKESEESEKKYGIELEAFKKQQDILKEKLAAAKEKYEHNPKEMPVEEPIQGPCEICAKLTERIRKNRNEYKNGEKEEPIVMEKLRNKLTEMLNEALEIAHLTLEIEYIKKRIPNQLQENSSDYEDRQCARKSDFHDRKDYSELMCRLMDKHFHTRTFKGSPTCALRMKMCDLEIMEFERLRENDMDMCCSLFRKLHCRRYFCRRYESEFRTKEERADFEKTSTAWIRPGLLMTDEGKKLYLDHIILELLDTLEVEKYSTIEISRTEDMRYWSL